jgi:hypothetical protein
MGPYGWFPALAYAREEHPFPPSACSTQQAKGRSALPTRPWAGRDTR